MWLPLIDPSLMPMIDLMQGTSRLFNSYVRDTLKYRSDLLYRGPFGEAFYPRPLPKNPAGLSEDWMTLMWNRGGARGGGRGAEGSPPAAAGQPAQPGGGGRGGRGNATDAPEPPPLRRAMELNPKLRVMNMKGMYDGSCAAMDESFARVEAHLKSRVTNHCYAGGHMMYSDLEVRREMQRDFAEFVALSRGQSP
jgi:hypothetical protein